MRYRYIWGNWKKGIVQEGGNALKVTATEYAQVRTYLPGARMDCCAPCREWIGGCILSPGTGYTDWIFWALVRKVSTDPPECVRQLLDPAGVDAPGAKGETVEIGTSPVLLVTSVP